MCIVSPQSDWICSKYSNSCILYHYLFSQVIIFEFVLLVRFIFSILQTLEILISFPALVVKWLGHGRYVLSVSFRAPGVHMSQQQALNGWMRGQYGYEWEAIFEYTWDSYPHLCIYIYIHTGTHTGTHTSTHVCVCVRVNVCLHLNISIDGIYAALLLWWYVPTTYKTPHECASTWMCFNVMI